MSHSFGAVVNSAVLLEGGGNSTEAEHRADTDSADAAAAAVDISGGGGGTSRMETRLSLWRQEYMGTRQFLWASALRRVSHCMLKYHGAERMGRSHVFLLPLTPPPPPPLTPRTHSQANGQHVLLSRAALARRLKEPSRSAAVSVAAARNALNLSADGHSLAARSLSFFLSVSSTP